MQHAVFPFLYGITDSQLMPGNLLEQKVEAALKAGLKLVQYRDKSEAHKARLREAKILQALCQKYSAIFIVNDDVELALTAGADGVHLGQEDQKISYARRLLGNKAIIGATCHNSLDLAAKAIEDGANYLAFGRFFSSKTKANAPTADLEILSQAKINFNVPIVAIGGVNENNAEKVWQAGADCVAICHALFAHDDPTLSIENIKNKYPGKR